MQPQKQDAVFHLSVSDIRFWRRQCERTHFQRLQLHRCALFIITHKIVGFVNALHYNKIYIIIVFETSDNDERFK